MQAVADRALSLASQLPQSGFHTGIGVMIIFLYRFRFHTGIGVMIALLWEQLSFSTWYMPDRMGL